MDSFEWNKIFGGILATALVVMVIRIGTEAIYEVEPLEKKAYVIEVPDEAASGAAAGPVAEQLPDWGTVIPAADVAHGQQVGQKCLQCHDWSKGGPNKIGPNLWNIVNRPRATEAGFDYSAAMKSKGGTWTYDDLYQYLKLPGAFIPGNKMAFAGLPSSKDRLDVIAFLRGQADSPAALPAPKPAEAAPAAPADGAAPAPAAGAAPAAPPAAP